MTGSGGPRAAADWLDAREAPAPASVRTIMDDLVAETDRGDALHHRFASAALKGLERVVAGPSDRRSATLLLAADALLTYACEAAAEVGLEELDALAASLDFHRFSRLVSTG